MSKLCLMFVPQWVVKNWGCSCTMGDRTNIGQILDKCPIVVKVLSNVCPIFAHVQVMSKICQIFGQLSIFCQVFVLLMSNLLLHFLICPNIGQKLGKWMSNVCPIIVQTHIFPDICKQCPIFVLNLSMSKVCPTFVHVQNLSNICPMSQVLLPFLYMSNFCPIFVHFHVQ